MVITHIRHAITNRPPVGAPASGPAPFGTPIKRDASGLARTAYCTEECDGGLTITAGHVRYPLAPEQLADGASFGETWFFLQDKNWFTPEVALDLANVVLARWYARASGWTA